MQSFLYLVHVYNANYFRDIPVGLLHLIPRGLVKHLLVQNVRQMNENRIKDTKPIPKIRHRFLQIHRESTRKGLQKLCMFKI